MKRIATLIIALFAISVAHYQSALCRQFMPQKSIQTYCVDNYPLGNDDSINVTFLMASDSDAYNTMLRFLISLPNTRGASSIEQRYKREMNPKKDFLIHLSATLPGDRGRYLTFFSPHNMSAMVFHIHNNDDMEKVVAHVLTKETTTD